MIDLNTRTVYVFVRQDLEFKHQLVQAGHAVMEMTKVLADGDDLVGVSRIIAIGFPNNEKVQKKIFAKLQEADIDFFSYVDQDKKELGITATATWPLTAEEAATLSNYRLWNERNNTIPGGELEMVVTEE